MTLTTEQEKAIRTLLRMQEACEGLQVSITRLQRKVFEQGFIPTHDDLIFLEGCREELIDHNKSLIWFDERWGMRIHTHNT